MLTPITHILPQTVVQRMRQLPVEGSIHVRQGETVRAIDVIASTRLKPKHFMLDIAAGLGVSNEAAARFIERYEGDDVNRGDVIARKAGLFNRIVRTPVDGKIVLITDGYVMIEEEQEPFKLLAGLPGEVIDLIHGVGAVIEATGALVQGTWGNGRIDSGVLSVIARDAAAELEPGMIDVGMRGSVLMSGRCTNPDVFRRAAEQRLRGLVLGGMPSEFIPVVRKLDLPVILTDGFGAQEMNPAAFRLLSTSDKRDVALNAEPYNPETGGRPEVVIPQPPAPGADTAPPAGRLEEGSRVRITREPHRGAWGKVTAILPGRLHFENGLRLPAASVQIDGGESIPVPLANLEIVNNN